MNCAIINHYQGMFGFDFHDGFPTAKFCPHFVAAPTMGMLTIIGVSQPETIAKKTYAGIGTDARVILRSHDIEMFIPHIPLAPNIPPIVALLMLGSGSICEMGGYSVYIEKDGQVPALGFPAVFLAMNLNCSDPINTPLGFQTAISTVLVGFSWADFFASMAHMFLDAIISALLDFGLGKLMEKIGPALKKAFSKLFCEPKFVKAFVDSAVDRFEDVVENMMGDLGAEVAYEALEDYMEDYIARNGQAISEAVIGTFTDMMVVGGGPGRDAPGLLNQVAQVEPISEVVIDQWIGGVPSAN